MAKTSTYKISSLKTIKGDPAFLGSVFDGSITELDLSETSITSLKGYAFYNSTSLKKVILPDTITKIGDYVFSGCNSLETIENLKLPSILPSYTFQNCKSLKTIDLSNVNRLKPNSLYYCTSLENLDMKDVLVIEQSAITYSNISEFPDNIVYIGTSNYNLAASTIENKIHSVPIKGKNTKWLLRNENSASTMEIADDIECIAEVAINNYSLKELTIPSSVKVFSSMEYNGIVSASTSFTKIHISSLDDWVKIDSGPLIKITKLVLEDKQKYMPIFSGKYSFGYGAGAFPTSNQNTYKTNLYIDGVQVDNVTEMTLPEDAGIGCLGSFNYLETLNLTLPNYIGDNNLRWSVGLYFGRSSSRANTQSTYTYYPTIAGSGSNYYFNSSYDSFYLPKTLKNYNITTDSIPGYFLRYKPVPKEENLISISNKEREYFDIGEWAFYCDTAFTDNITFNGKVRNIGTYGLHWCTLNNFELYDKEEYLNIGENALYGSKGITSLYIPKLYESHFGALSSLDLEEVTFKTLFTKNSSSYHALRVIGTNGSAPGGSIQVSIPDSWTNLDDLNTQVNAASGGGFNSMYISPSLKKITVLEGNIPSKSFYSASYLNEIKLPTQGCSYIGSYAFTDCTGISEIELPQTLEYIGKYAFYNSTIKNISIPKSVKKLYFGVFYMCPELETVIFENAENSELHTIEDQVFYYCSKLKTVVIPAGITIEGSNCFTGVPSTCNVFCLDTEKPANWNNNWNGNTTVYWGGTWHYDENGEPVPNE